MGAGEGEEDPSLSSLLLSTSLTPHRPPPAQGYTADMAWRWLLGNRRDTAQRMQLEQAGFSFKFRSRLFSVPVTLWVGTTDHGRGLMVDQALVPKGTTVATATGTIVERKTPPPKLRNGRPSYSLKVPGKVESSKPRYIVLDPPTLEHPGNLVNSVLSKEKTEERSANVSFRYCPEKQLVVFTATRALARGDELLADYSGCPAMRRQMKKSQEEAAADAAQAAAEEAEQRAAKLAAAGRDSGGRFTSRNGVGRACPKCGYAKAQMATPLGWNRHVNLCPGG